MLRGEARVRWLTRFALAAPMAFHGLWNLGHEGAVWWQTQSGLPVGLRWLVGLGELAAALSLLTNIAARLAAACLVPVMLGAITQHWRAGFSFKHGGWESPFVYCVLALSIALDSSGKRASSGGNLTALVGRERT